MLLFCDESASCCSVWKLSSVLLICDEPVAVLKCVIQLLFSSVLLICDESVVVLCGNCQVCYCFVMSQLLFCVESVKCAIVL